MMIMMQTTSDPYNVNVKRVTYSRDNLIKSCGDSKNLWESFEHGYNGGGMRSRTRGDSNFMASRAKEDSSQYVWKSYENVRRDVLCIMHGMIMNGCKVQDMIGIFSLNTIEWVSIDLACNAGNFVCVPIYSTFGKDAICHIIDQTKMKIIFASGANARYIIELPIDRIPSLEMIVIMDDDYRLDENETRGIKFMKLTNLIDEGSRELGKNEEEGNASYDDIATICYTSGTTGMPKGVILTHGNILSELAALEYASKENKLFTPCENDIHISYLPLAHIFERLMVAYMLRVGGKIGFYRGVTGADASKALMNDIATLKPTIFISVPRIYNKLYEKVMTEVSHKGGIIQYMFNKGMSTKLKKMKAKHKYKHFLWDHLVFKKVRKILGGNVRVMVTGSAPLSDKVMNFLRIAFNAEVYEGYGQTETSAGVTLTLRGDHDTGHVGPPLPNCEIMLMDLPEMGYFTNDKPFPRGEICVRGYQVFKSYYKDDEKTRDAFTDDGWYKTGDVGSWDEKGRLVIIDRKKSLFKLAQGEYVSPEKVETLLSTNSKLISQIYVTGDSLQNHVVAVVVPDKEYLQKALHDRDMNDHFENVKMLLLNDIQNIGINGGLNGYEIPKNIHIEYEPFGEDMMTPTFKLKRNIARERYAYNIANMYRNV